MSEEKVPVTESVSNFNVYSAEIRNKIDVLVKQVLLVSGGVQTITIGAFLGGKTPTLSQDTVYLLEMGESPL